MCTFYFIHISETSVLKLKLKQEKEKKVKRINCKNWAMDHSEDRATGQLKPWVDAHAGGWSTCCRRPALMCRD